MQTKAAFLGIWLDHATAHLMEFSFDKMESTTLDSAFTHTEKEEAIVKGEKLMHHAEQHGEGAYYKKLEAIILGYSSVLLFGPTDAKQELYNQLKADKKFDHIKLIVKSADKMTVPQQHAFVKNYFVHHLD